MSLRLKEAVYRIKCRAPGCTFVSEAPIRENIMGATERDVDTEVLKIAKNLAFIKHDAMHGRKHDLTNPEIMKVSAQYERLGGGIVQGSERAPNVHTFARGQVIYGKEEDGSAVFEVLRGSVRNVRYNEITYSPGSGFATGTLFGHPGAFAGVVAATDDTVVSRHDFGELQRSNPAEARRLYEMAMGDLFRLIAALEKRVANSVKVGGKAKPVSTSARPSRRAVRPAARPVARPASKVNAGAPARKAHAKK